jgi:hypothetical protein
MDMQRVATLGCRSSVLYDEGALNYMSWYYNVTNDTEIAATGEWQGVRCNDR